MIGTKGERHGGHFPTVRRGPASVIRATNEHGSGFDFKASEEAAIQVHHLLSEGDNHLYVGRTRKLRSRLRQHSIPAAQHNQAVFAFKLAREATSFTEASFRSKGSRRDLLADPRFADAFGGAKARIREMDLRFVEETDPLRQALLEIYAAVTLGTKYNDFETH